jgi:hypothetical protein
MPACSAVLLAWNALRIKMNLIFSFPFSTQWLVALAMHYSM